MPSTQPTAPQNHSPPYNFTSPTTHSHSPQRTQRLQAPTLPLPPHTNSPQPVPTRKPGRSRIKPCHAPPSSRRVSQRPPCGGYPGCWGRAERGPGRLVEPRCQSRGCVSRACWLIDAMLAGLGFGWQALCCVLAARGWEMHVARDAVALRRWRR